MHLRRLLNLKIQAGVLEGEADKMLCFWGFCVFFDFFKLFVVQSTLLTVQAFSGVTLYPSVWLCVEYLVAPDFSLPVFAGEAKFFDGGIVVSL